MNNIANLQNSINQTGITTQKQPQTTQTTQIFKNQPQTPAQQTAQQAVDSIDKLISKVVDELQSASNINQTSKILQMAKDTKIAPNFTNDIKNLAATIQSDPAFENSPTLKDLVLKLKEFLKPIADLKTAPLNEQIKSSGVLLEANLKEALNTQKIPQSIQKLLTDIKNLSNQNLLNQILTLANDESLDNHSSFVKLNEILTNEAKTAQNTLNNSNIKALFSDTNKLDNIARYLNNTAQKGEISAQNALKQASSLNSFLTNLNEKISNITSEKLNQTQAFSQNIKELKILIKDMQNSLASLNKIGDEAGVVRNFNAILNDPNASLQDKLSSAARRLGVALLVADSHASNAKVNLNEIKSLQKQIKSASNDVAQIALKTQSEMTPTSDIKSTLLSIVKEANTQNLNQTIKDTSLKMISQIELHQIVSSVSGGLQTYLPYVWDGVDEGKVAFKQGKKDRFYAQIELNFKQYGQVSVMVGLSNKRYIDISIATATSEFKELILGQNSELKRAIGELGLVVSNFNLKVLSKHEISQKFKNFDGLQIGFDRRA
ncbi:hypothetical protein [Campylobacter gastrosuis]|uniref:Flagellar hook-length control protein FliK n=1 Tax=Campylobacter gastrosuis TaxID=2974576 RepID=A0ABT7HTI9_9BACT|nr:hypothetical protein [Campylobacter gastrosuis]MDL0089689.1 hypothetical protein [Campylobacter gastrosuis]